MLPDTNTNMRTIKTPDNVQTSILENVVEAYTNPENSMEAFLLYAAKAELEKRGHEREQLQSGCSESTRNEGKSADEIAEEFEALVNP